MKFKFIIILVAILMLGAFNVNSIKSKEPYINISNVENSKNFKGFIKHRIITKLYFQNEGKISFLPYKEGDYVKKGQVIARLDGYLYKIKKEKFNLNNEINYNIIVSPINGYIGKIYKPLNSYVKNKEPVLEIYSANKTEAEALVGANYINKINLNKSAKVEYKNEIYEAKIANILKSSDDYIIELEFDSLHSELKEGANIDVKLDFE